MFNEVERSLKYWLNKSFCASLSYSLSNSLRESTEPSLSFSLSNSLHKSLYVSSIDSLAFFLKQQILYEIKEKK